MGTSTPGPGCASSTRTGGSEGASTLGPSASAVRAVRWAGTKIDEEEPEDEPEQWCMGVAEVGSAVATALRGRAVEQGPEEFEELVLIDSGSDEHMCPPSFAPGTQTRTRGESNLRDVQGRRLRMVAARRSR